MALFHDGGHGPEVAFPFKVLSESDCQRTSFDLSSREELLSGYGIRIAFVHCFTTLKNFKKICMEGYDYDLGRVLTRYVAFDNVDNKNVLAIDQHCENRRDLPNMRVLYDEELHLLIIKVMVGIHHESAGGLIATVVMTKLITTGIDPFSCVVWRSKMWDCGEET